MATRVLQQPFDSHHLMLPTHRISIVVRRKIEIPDQSTAACSRSSVGQLWWSPVNVGAPPPFIYLFYFKKKIILDLIKKICFGLRQKKVLDLIKKIILGLDK